MSKNVSLSQSKNFERHFVAFSSAGLQIYKVFEDFLEMTLLSFCNASPLRDEKREAREKRYMEIVGRYKPELIELFLKMLADLINLMEDGGEPDVLGEFFMNHITHGENGQFFTPTHICDMMAAVTLGDNSEPGQSVVDPACGSGRTLLSALKMQPKLKVTACDLDWRCTKMAAINLFLRGATGRAICMNSLSLEIYGGYEFGIWGGCVPYLIELNKDEITITEPQKEQIKEATQEKNIGGLFSF